MLFPINNQVIGHRGASAYAPENTLSSFNQALTLGCNFMEFDVMLSADGEPLIFHDNSLKRTTKVKGEFGLVESSYLQTLDAGKWFSKHYLNEKIPHFADVVQWLISNNINANIEIKPYPGPESAERTLIAVMSILNSHWPNDKPLPLISSFDHDVLSLCHSIAPEMPLGLLFDKWEADWSSKATQLQCHSININYRTLTKERVTEIKDKGFAIYAYTVNRRRLAKKLLNWGVDAIFSDYPDLLT